MGRHFVHTTSSYRLGPGAKSHTSRYSAESESVSLRRTRGRRSGRPGDVPLTASTSASPRPCASSNLRSRPRRAARQALPPWSWCTPRCRTVIFLVQPPHTCRIGIIPFVPCDPSSAGAILPRWCRIECGSRTVVAELVEEPGVVRQPVPEPRGDGPLVPEVSRDDAPAVVHQDDEPRAADVSGSSRPGRPGARTRRGNASRRRPPRRRPRAASSRNRTRGRAWGPPDGPNRPPSARRTRGNYRVSYLSRRKTGGHSPPAAFTSSRAAGATSRAPGLMRSPPNRAGSRRPSPPRVDPPRSVRAGRSGSGHLPGRAWCLP